MPRPQNKARTIFTPEKPNETDPGSNKPMSAKLLALLKSTPAKKK